MVTYVLVGGACLGGWCWQPVARRLRDNGHDAYPVTLTALGKELGWSGYNIDPMQTWWTELQASISPGLIWAA
jgi:hypothetical protein